MVPFLTGEHLAKSAASLIRNRYAGRVAVILASGPSLSSEQIGATMLRKRQDRCVVFTVNSTWQRFWHADVHYSNDFDWYAANIDAMKQSCRGEFWCGFPGHKVPGVFHIPFDKEARGLRSRHADAISWGGNSGAGCISLAALAGCKTILLAGFDQQGEHWHDPHPEPIRKAFNWPLWAEYFSAIAAEAKASGISIINCSEQTSLSCFPRGALQEELAKCSRC